MDEQVFEANWENMNDLMSITSQNEGLFDLYFEFILNNPPKLSDSIRFQQMKRFAEDPVMNQFYDAIEENFAGALFDPYKQEIDRAFSYYQYYFPDQEIPELMTFQGGFNYKIVPNDTLLGLGLEWYIGKDNDLIKKLSPQAFPQFEKNKMQPEYLVVDAVKGFLKVKYQEQMRMENLLSVMIFYGKIQYLTDAMLHDKADHLKLNYSEAEYEWLVKNEKEIWTFLAEQNLLFDNNLRVITQWVNDGPFTTGLPQESPSRAGIYMGWRLVQHYMDKHPDMSLQELIDKKNDNAILSAYKPR